MTTQTASIDVAPELLEAISSFPTTREIMHCGTAFQVSPFEIYAICPVCTRRIKVRSFSANPELEDVFDRVFEWLEKPGALELMSRRQSQLADD